MRTPGFPTTPRVLIPSDLGRPGVQGWYIDPEYYQYRDCECAHVRFCFLGGD